MDALNTNLEVESSLPMFPTCKDNPQVCTLFITAVLKNTKKNHVFSLSSQKMSDSFYVKRTAHLLWAS